MFYRRLRFVMYITLLAALQSACVSQRAQTPPALVSPSTNPAPISSLTAAAAALDTPQPAAETATPAAPTAGSAAPPEPLPRTQYQLTAVLNYDQHYLVVDEQIRYTNRQAQELPDLRLMVDPLYYPGVFVLKNLSWEDGQPVDDYAVETGQIHINLPEPLPPGASIALSLNYELYLPSPVPSAAVRPIPFGYTARQANLVDWYPFIPPYLPGSGWQAHQAGFFGEHLVYEQADFEVSLRVSDAQPELIIAASAPATRQDEWYHYRHQAARNFAWSASREYQVSSATIGDTTVMSYAFPFHAAAGEAVLNTTVEALRLYNELYGPYPRQLLNVVEADFLDGMEYDGMYFLSNGFYNLYQGQPGEYLIAIAAHETAHQWFYALVGNDQALEPWLDEALCTYQERIYYEKLHPEALDWWWAYRVNYYNPSGWVDGSIYNPAGYRAYRDAVYLNGAVFLEALRAEIGDEAFFSFLKDYVGQMQGQIATRERFFEILSQHTDKDLSLLLGKYFQN